MSFKDLSGDEEGFLDFQKKQENDDKKVLQYLENCNHEEFIFAVSQIGVLLDTIQIYKKFLLPQINDAIENLNSKSLNRKMNKFIKDLNERIRFEYDFDDGIIIIEDAVLFNKELYLFFNKQYFIEKIGIEKIFE